LNKSQETVSLPANRPHLDRDAKTAEILDAAESLLLEDGYESTTMSAIARKAGISSNAVYWYFPGKDELLAAVLSRRQQQALDRLDQAPDASLVDRARTALGELDSIANLSVAVHERAKHSTAVAAVHEAFHATMSERLYDAFTAAGLGEPDARMAAAAIVAIVEGVHLHDAPYDPAARDELVLWALRHFAGDAAG
jgi:AcrR family transcriptional regulator